MENKKTIGHLKSKAWYRLLKVFFTLALLFVLGSYNLIAYSGGIKQVDQDGTTIKCNLYGKNTFSPASINISLRASDFNGGQFDYRRFFEGYNDYTVMAILKGCGNPSLVFTGADSYDEQRAAEIANSIGGIIGTKDHTQEQITAFTAQMDTYKQQTSNVFGMDKTRYLDFSFKMFDITPVFTYRGFLELFFIGNVVILLFFEVMRRVFYYIVLGSIKPEK
jgi:hypothetical protein